MKIERAEIHVVRQTLGTQSFCYSQAWYNTRSMLLLELFTDQGVSGWGEAFGNPFVNKAILENVYLPLVIGQDPLDRACIWNRLYNVLRDHGQKGATIEALSAVDIALWDIAGKAFHLPVYKLMGGASRQEIIPYATGFYRTAGITDADLVAEAARYREQGFRGMKIKVGFGVENDSRVVHAIRREVGEDVLLMADANHAYTACDALRFARLAEDCHLSWLEEPVPPEDIDGYREVRAASPIPIAGGEAEFTRYGFARLLGERCVDIAQPDCCVTGGLSELIHIGSLATIHNIRCCPHIWGSGVALRAGMQAAFYLPDYPDALFPAPMLLEYDRTPNIFREQLNLLPLHIQDGKVALPEEEGLGFVPDRQLLARYEVK